MRFTVVSGPGIKRFVSIESIAHLMPHDPKKSIVDLIVGEHPRACIGTPYGAMSLEQARKARLETLYVDLETANAIAINARS
jgi:hypothetical protein